MRLNHDCIREVLLCIEENTDFRKNCMFVDAGPIGSDTAEFLGRPLEIPPYQAKLMEHFDNNQILYHACYCLDAALANGETRDDRVIVYDLTPYGHELLARIRDPERWPKVKKGVAAVRDYSIAALGAVAEGITAAAISALPFGQK